MKYDIPDMCRSFDRLYNPHPADVAREYLFRCALKDGLITEEVYQYAKNYYGNLWNYVGD